MRPIKFRAWDKNNNTMEYIDDFYWFEESGVHDFEGQGHFSEYSFQQYTGLKDKNGAEIYEGDILRTQDITFHQRGVSKVHNIITKVHWMESGWYETVIKSSLNHLNTTFPIAAWEQSEVIGNIFEHPHLLEVSES